MLTVSSDAPCFLASSIVRQAVDEESSRQAHGGGHDEAPVDTGMLYITAATSCCSWVARRSTPARLTTAKAVLYTSVA